MVQQLPSEMATALLLQFHPESDTPRLFFLCCIFSPKQSAPLAYISGTMGVLIGADLLHLRDIPKLGAPHAPIGDAGTFDGIFITGIVAALLV